MIKRVVVLWLTVWLLLAGLWWLSASPWLRLVTNPRLAASVARYVEVAELVESSYVSRDKATHDKLSEAALHGLAASLDDYSEYYSEAEFEVFDKGSRNLMTGIGVRMAEIDLEPVVVRVFSGTPAAEVGLLPGDRLVRIGTSTVEGAGWEAAHRALQSSGSEPVEITWRRPSTGETMRKTLERRELTAPTVHRFPVDAEGVAYVELSHFTERTTAELSLALREAQHEGAKGLVLDLRGNPGGLLDAAVDAAGIFLPSGSKVLSVQGREGDPAEEYFCSRQLTEWKGEVVLLLDRESASASEVLAAALQDHGRAQVVGSRSYGKGSVQTVRPLRHGGGLRLTVAHYTSPKGRVIQGKGVEPDLALEKADEAGILEREAWGWKPEEMRKVFGNDPRPDPAIGAARARLAQVVAERNHQGSSQK